MDGEGDYADYLRRREELTPATRNARRLLEPEKFVELWGEYKRLLARWDPADIQLDEWKRMEELRFVLALPDDEVEE